MSLTSDTWLAFVVSLPSAAATARMRIWRAVKAQGCAALRDGTYLLPAQAEQAAQLQTLADEALQEGGQAWLLRVQAKDMAEQAAYQALFDRTADYAPWLEELAQARQLISSLSAAELQRLQRRHARTYEAIRKIDFFPGESSIRAEAQWRDFTNAVEAIQSPGEPQAAAGRIARRDRMQYQGRLWATRRHLWVDRVASAWLIQRFIDPAARFVWLDLPADCPADALGFDFDGATFSHVGDRVTFEVLMASFGLDGDRGLASRWPASGSSKRCCMKWVTRERPKIDRIACPWLIARFIDQAPEFLYVPATSVLQVAQETGAIPYDVPGVEMTHEGDLCSFDAFLKKYDLTDAALQQLAVIVRGADTSRLDLAPQSAGLYALSLGLSKTFRNDHEMLGHGMVMYDALYAWCQSCQAETHNWPPSMAA